MTGNPALDQAADSPKATCRPEFPHPVEDEGQIRGGERPATHRGGNGHQAGVQADQEPGHDHRVPQAHCALTVGAGGNGCGGEALRLGGDAFLARLLLFYSHLALSALQQRVKPAMLPSGSRFGLLLGGPATALLSSPCFHDDLLYGLFWSNNYSIEKSRFNRSNTWSSTTRILIRAGPCTPAALTPDPRSTRPPRSRPTGRAARGTR